MLYRIENEYALDFKEIAGWNIHFMDIFYKFYLRLLYN